MYIPGFLYIFSRQQTSCFCVLAVMNRAAVNISGVYLFKLVFSFSSGKYPGVEFLEHTVVLFLIFRALCLLLSVAAVPSYMPTDHAGTFPHLHILSDTCCLLSF